MKARYLFFLAALTVLTPCCVKRELIDLVVPQPVSVERAVQGERVLDAFSGRFVSPIPDDATDIYVPSWLFRDEDSFFYDANTLKESRYDTLSFVSGDFLYLFPVQQLGYQGLFDSNEIIVEQSLRHELKIGLQGDWELSLSAQGDFCSFSEPRGTGPRTVVLSFTPEAMFLEDLKVIVDNGKGQFPLSVSFIPAEEAIVCAECDYDFPGGLENTEIESSVSWCYAKDGKVHFLENRSGQSRRAVLRFSRPGFATVEVHFTQVGRPAALDFPVPGIYYPEGVEGRDLKGIYPVNVKYSRDSHKVSNIYFLPGESSFAEVSLTSYPVLLEAGSTCSLSVFHDGFSHNVEATVLSREGNLLWLCSDVLNCMSEPLYAVYLVS